MAGLRIARELALPLDAVTSTLIVYGGKGMGKTNFGAVLAEEISRARRRFCVIDPLGVWFGLAFGVDGTGPGIPFVGLGGPKGDIPITPLSGVVVADFVADESVSTVVTLLHADGRMWTVGERIRFVADFMYRLFERQGEKKLPLHLLIDEAGRFVPQQIPAGAVDIARCVGGIEQMVEWGRNVAVGVTLITQRSARMNKSVSELADAMVAFRTVGPRSIDAIIDWLGDHVPKERTKEIIEQLRALPIGTALVISPGWLQLERVVAMRARETFDSSRTPDGGAAAMPRGLGSKPDLDKYRDRMAATIEEADATDPRKLQTRIRELEKSLKNLQARPAPPERVVETVEKVVEVPVLNGQVEHLQAVAVTLGQVGQEIARVGGEIVAAIARVQAAPPPAPVIPAVRRESGREPDQGRTAAPPAQRGASASGPAVGSSDRPPGEPSGDAGDVSIKSVDRAILGVLAQFPEGRSQRQLGILTGYSPTGGGVRGSLAKLRAGGLIEGPGTAIRITKAGVAAAGDVTPLPAGEELLRHWLERLPKAASAILDVLVGVYPESMTQAELGERTGMSATGGGVRGALADLRKLELIEGPGSAIRAHPEFAEGVR